MIEALRKLCQIKIFTNLLKNNDFSGWDFRKNQVKKDRKLLMWLFLPSNPFRGAAKFSRLKVFAQWQLRL
ncbi:MAG: hypothetical protein A3J37_08520 [Alphaproteobacteria bacterium RIFCSPHIGHO2_12_FULL_45_9]|nr:MAG: hypothetical protein A3J37_08520 [Alphaproteobacteria bacterium RIFCSPHIGHO2_12_FULL_45_9]